MDELTRERVERQHRPNLFKDCISCGEESVRVSTHKCDPIRQQTYMASFAMPEMKPNEEMVKLLEEKLLSVFIKHRMVISSEQLREFALAIEPSTRGGYAMGATG